MAVGDGIYIVADGESLNPGYPQIEPGVYRSAGEAFLGATYELFGGFGNLLFQGVGFLGEVTIVIPRMCWAFQTTGMRPWTRIADVPTLWLRMPDDTWFNITDPQPGAPANLTSGLYNAYQMRIQTHPDGLNWLHQTNGFIPLRVRHPDGYWLNVMQFDVEPDGGSPDPGFMFDILPFGLDSSEADTSYPIWYVRQSTLGISESSGIPISGNVFSEVFNDPSLGPLFDIRREYYAVDLDLVRWAKQALDPDNQFSLSLRFEGGVSCFEIIGGIQVDGDWGEARLSNASGSTTYINAYPDNENFVSGNYVPRISLTGPATPGSALHTFTAVGSPTPQYFDLALNLAALEDVHSLEFELNPVTPATPAEGDTARVAASVSVNLAFNP